MRIALGVEYEGSPFTGWQSQPHGNTVQDVLERAIASVAGVPVATVCAGRTDTGVHALGQVVHFDTNVMRPDTAWVRGVNANLPAAVGVRWAVPVGDDFHARFCARARSYRYLLLDRPVRPALLHGRVGWHHTPLDVGAMNAAAARLVGEHDFSTFRSSECQAKSPVKLMRVATAARQADLIVFDFTASAFLHHMVRNLVGALVYIGSGRQSPEWVDALLAARDRSKSAPTFAASGLYFVGAEYGPEWSLPSSGRIMASSHILPLPT